jgi:FAD/FMN-containing dehydrogenase
MNQSILLAENKINEKLGIGLISDLSPHHLTEPRDNFKNFALRLIRPKTTKEVSTVLSILNAFKVKVIPYSGGTGLVGGQMAPNSDLMLLSLDRMNALRSSSAEDGTMTVESGMILSEVQRQAKKTDRIFPLSLASEGTCQIGGNLATNAGGINVIRYGNARDLCLGVEAVLADGTVYNGLGSLFKDNTGYDLRHLLIGSEGTLGVITAATLKTFPLPDETIVSLIKINTPTDAIMLLRRFQKCLGNQIQAFELISRRGLEFLERGNFDYKEPFPERGDWMVLVEISGAKPLNLRNVFENILHQSILENLAMDAIIAESHAQEAALWNIRENIPEANRLIGAICSSDISVPISNIPNFIDTTNEMIKALCNELQINCFGHLGDGNIHFNVFPPIGKTKSDFISITKAVADIIHETAIGLGGSFSAEHGVGRLKVLDLKKYGDAGKLTMMRAIKNSLDPNLILNPGVILSEL